MWRRKSDNERIDPSGYPVSTIRSAIDILKKENPRQLEKSPARANSISSKNLDIDPLSDENIARYSNKDIFYFYSLFLFFFAPHHLHLPLIPSNLHYLAKKKTTPSLILEKSRKFLNGEEESKPKTSVNQSFLTNLIKNTVEYNQDSIEKQKKLSVTFRSKEEEEEEEGDEGQVGSKARKIKKVRGRGGVGTRGLEKEGEISGKRRRSLEEGGGDIDDSENDKEKTKNQPRRVRGRGGVGSVLLREGNYDDQESAIASKKSNEAKEENSEKKNKKKKKKHHHRHRILEEGNRGGGNDDDDDEEEDESDIE